MGVLGYYFILPVYFVISHFYSNTCAMSDEWATFCRISEQMGSNKQYWWDKIIVPVWDLQFQNTVGALYNSKLYI
jgi:hypothetical protein